MKQVTIAGVKDFINEIEKGGLSLREEYVLACLRELVAVTEQRDALVAESVGLKTFISQSCYSYDGDGSDVCDSYIDAESSPFFPETPATYSTIASLRAEGVDMAVSHLIEKFNGTGIGVPVMALEHLARQLRESKGANHE